MTHRHLAIVAVVLAFTLAVPTTALATPPQDGEHGLSSIDVTALFSEDTDTGDVPDNTTKNTSEEWMRGLLNATDWTYTTHPTEVVNRWNAGEHNDFTPGGNDTSRYPEGTARTDSTYIKDAYIRVFSVTPSTVVHEGNTTTTLVNPTGTVRAVSDYRVEVPQDTTTENRTVNWSVTNAEITQTTLLIDGEEVAETDGSHSPSLGFSDVSGTVGITIRATIETTLQKETRTRVEECSEVDGGPLQDGGDGGEVCSSEWVTQTTTVSDSVQVSDSRTAEVDSPSVEAAEQRKTGDGVAYSVSMDDEYWQTISVGGSTVRSPWRFYTRGNTEWGTMVAETRGGTENTSSDAYPVSTHAFHSTYGVKHTTGAVEVTKGETTRAPELPDVISVSAIETQQPSVIGFTLQRSGQELTERTAKVRGLVGSSESTAQVESVATEETITTVEVMELRPDNVTIRVSVTDVNNNAVTSGVVVAGNETRKLNESGGVMMTVSRPPVSVVAEYQPAEGSKYRSSSDSAPVGGMLPGFDFLARLAVATLIWALPAYGLIYAYRMFTTNGKNG